MFQTNYVLKKMDCPTEERLVRMSLANVATIRSLTFDLAARKLSVCHEGPAELITEKLVSLDLGASLSGTTEVTSLDKQASEISPVQELKTLKIVLAINAAMFVIEFVIGFVAQSTGLISDSLDMFADAAVYGISLYSVGRGVIAQKRSARISGLLQIALALGAIIEVVRRAVGGSEPQSTLMLAMALVALIANIFCLRLVTRHKEGGAHMKASVIFSTNDVLANLGVIMSAILLRFIDSNIPDLIVGALIAVIVFQGGIRIIKISR